MGWPRSVSRGIRCRCSTDLAGCARTVLDTAGVVVRQRGEVPLVGIRRWRFPATGPLAHPAPGDEREVGSEQTLGRRVHPLDHHLVLVGEQYLVQPADVRPVA